MFILTQNNRVEIEPKTLWIPEFKAVWEADRTKKKAKATKEFAYIYFMADYKSEFNIFGLEKPRIIGEDIMGSSEYDPSQLVLDAIKKYEKLQESFSMRYLRSVRDTVNSLMVFYEELRFKKDQTDMKNFDPTKVTKGLKDVETILSQLEKWEKKIICPYEAEGSSPCLKMQIWQHG